MEVFWYRIRSWHAGSPSRALVGRTYCGRTVPGDAQWSTDLPGGKSCETCLRILAKRTGE